MDFKVDIEVVYYTMGIGFILISIVVFFPDIISYFKPSKNKSSLIDPEELFKEILRTSELQYEKFNVPSTKALETEIKNLEVDQLELEKQKQMIRIIATSSNILKNIMAKFDRELTAKNEPMNYEEFQKKLYEFLESQSLKAKN